MSVPNRRKKKIKLERSSLQLAEESFHLLRSVDLRYFWLFYLGVIPFVVGLLYFVADMSRSGLAEDNIMIASLVMVGLYFWMRIFQSIFCKGLWDTIAPAAQDSLPWTTRFRQGVALCLFQAFQVPLLFVGFLFLVPLGWIVAALQNASVFGFTATNTMRPFRSLVRDSFRHSHVDWAQNHAVLIIFAFVGLFTWLNIIATALLVPTLVKAFFGVESVFTISPAAAVGNSTFFLGTLLLTYLVISPILKAAYTLRCFYAESRHTGADLLSRLARCEKRQEGRATRSPDRLAKASVILLSGLVLLSPVSARESESSPLPAEEGTVGISEDAFQKEITTTLEQKKYQWQLSQRALDIEGEEETSWLARRMRDLAESTREAMKSFSDWIREQFEKMRRERNPTPGGDRGTDFKFSEGLGSSFSIALGVILAGLVAWLLWVMYRKYRGKAPKEGEEVAMSVVDLQSEDIVASQLPEDEWMRLAREQMDKGDKRLAVRALFLASLAHLGEVGLLRIARFKSNRDYREELARRARKHERLRTSFERNTQLFEQAWYGWHSVEEETVEEFLENHRAIAGESAKVPGTHSASPHSEPQPA